MEAGLENVTQVVLKSFISPWPKRKVLKESERFHILAHLENSLRLVYSPDLARFMGARAGERSFRQAKTRAQGQVHTSVSIKVSWQNAVISMQIPNHGQRCGIGPKAGKGYEPRSSSKLTSIFRPSRPSSLVILPPDGACWRPSAGDVEQAHQDPRNRSTGEVSNECMPVIHASIHEAANFNRN